MHNAGPLLKLQSRYLQISVTNLIGSLLRLNILRGGSVQFTCNLKMLINCSGESVVDRQAALSSVHVEWSMIECQFTMFLALKYKTQKIMAKIEDFFTTHKHDINFFVAKKCGVFRR